MSRHSGKLRRIIKHENKKTVLKNLVIDITEFPGGIEGFELISRFCYNNAKIQITPLNISMLHSSAVYLEMTEKFYPCNLVKQAESFLAGLCYWSWTDILVCLKSCESFFSSAESSGLLDKLISSLLAKIGQNPILDLTPSSSPSTSSPEIGLRFSLSNKATPYSTKTTKPRSPSKAWWFEDLTMLSPKIIEKVIKSMGYYRPNNNSLVLTKFLIHYLKRASGKMGGGSAYSVLTNTVVHGVVVIGQSDFSCRGLFWVLRVVSSLGLSKECRVGLERLIGGVLDKATLDDILVSGQDGIGVYDVNLVLRLLRVCVKDETMSVERIKKVGILIDKYMGEISPDHNLKVPKFLTVAESLPDCARDCFDGVYRATDIYLERLGSLSYFAGAEKKDEHVLVPDLGSLTSTYDRARQLFYYLKGGRVDYGEEHSRIYGHSQFGKTYGQGNYPEWDEDHPIHFVGHSAGAQVVRLLQQMLADKAFKGHENTSENWILSVTSLSGAFNGTTRTYLDGIQPEDGKSLKPICLLQLCRIGVIIYDWLDIAWLKKYYNFGFDHFNMSWRKAGVLGLIDCLLGSSGPFASTDWILPDLSIQGSVRLNYHLKTFPKTFYFSYATKQTRKLMGATVPCSILGIHPMLFIRVLQMSQWSHPPDVPPPFKGYKDKEWQDNDGALNTISMTHPRIPVEHPNHLVLNESECQPLQPGIWYYKIVEGDHILFIVNRERAGVQFDLIYDSIFERCRKHVFSTTPPTLPNHIQQCELSGT